MFDLYFQIICKLFKIAAADFYYLLPKNIPEQYVKPFADAQKELEGSMIFQTFFSTENMMLALIGNSIKLSLW
jgi:hypothetical protein